MYENAALGDVSQNQYSSWLYLVLYLSLNTPPDAVFSVHACSSVLSSSYIKCMVSTTHGSCIDFLINVCLLPVYKM